MEPQNIQSRLKCYKFSPLIIRHFSNPKAVPTIITEAAAYTKTTDGVAIACNPAKSKAGTISELMAVYRKSRNITTNVFGVPVSKPRSVAAETMNRMPLTAAAE